MNRRINNIILIIFIAITFVVALTSCNPSKHLARFLKRHPELSKTDTIFRTDTIITKEVKTDSIFHYNQPDTITIVKDKLEIKYCFKRDSVFISGKCKSDTIYKSYPVYINTVAVAKALTLKQRIKLWLFDNWIWIFLAVSLFVFLFRATIWGAIKSYLRI